MLPIAYLGQGLLSFAAIGAILAAILPLSLLNLRRLLILYTLLVVGAFSVLLYAHVSDDFSLLNVVRHSHTLKPFLYKVAGVWGNHEGSMLLWLLLLAGYTAVLIRVPMEEGAQKTFLSLMALINAAFALFIAFACDPFAPIAVPLQEGLDLNPMLQDPALAIHPPVLYLGYVGFAVPFCWILTNLLHHKNDRGYYPWTLFAWGCLTAGIILGSFWAYYELGWGGWWFWDPVENAALMPWLAATAFIHCHQIKADRWAWFLGILTFSFCLIGLVFVRSGVVSSVHAFATDPERGLLLLLIAAFISLPAFGIYGLRRPGEGAYINRWVMVASFLLLAALLAILLGTLFPVIAQWMDKALTVDGPYFNKTAVPLLLAAFVLMGVAPFRSGIQTILPAFTLSSAVMLGFYVIGYVTNLLGAIALLIGLWIIAATVLNRPRAALFFAHGGVGLAIIGMALSLMNEQEVLKAVRVGESLRLNGYTMTLVEMRRNDGRNYQAQQAVFSITGPRFKKELTPEMRLYWTQNLLHGETSIVSDGLHHLYASLGDSYTNGQVDVRLNLKPFINLMWLGGILACLGCFLALRKYVK